MKDKMKRRPSTSSVTRMASLILAVRLALLLFFIIWTLKSFADPYQKLPLKALFRGKKEIDEGVKFVQGRFDGL